jgi:hypothetical protein
VAQQLLTISGLTSRWQMGMNAACVIISVTLLVAASDMRAILLPYQPPHAVAPASPSSSCLWVSLDTRHPRYFDVVLESGFWADRRAEVLFHAEESASARAEISLLPLANKSTEDVNDGTVWIERRPCFLTREFFPGERIGRYTLRYLTGLGTQ